MYVKDVFSACFFLLFPPTIVDDGHDELHDICALPALRRTAQESGPTGMNTNRLAAYADTRMVLCFFSSWTFTSRAGLERQTY
jgi:hypothetical protein